MEQEDTPDLADQAAEIAQIGQGLIGQAQTFLESLLRPWNAYQILIALGLLVLAHLLGRPIQRRFHDWLRTREGWPKWRLRLALTTQKRTRGILFVILIWLTVLIMREVTWKFTVLPAEHFRQPGNGVAVRDLCHAADRQ